MEEVRITEGLNYVHLFSGGLDSTYGLLKLAKEIDKGKKKGTIQPIFMDYGHFAATTEWNRAQKLAHFIRTKLGNAAIINTPIRISLRSELFTWCHNVAFTGKEVGDETCEIQNRNMVLFSILFSYLMACAQNQGVKQAVFEIYSGFKDGEMNDCSSSFLNGLCDLFSCYQKQYIMKIYPLPSANRHQTHEKIKKLLNGSQADLDKLLALTTSCYSPRNGGQPCRKCWKCKQVAKGKG